MSEPIISDRRADTRQAVTASAHCTLRPGERIIGGRVFYSAAWLSPQPEVEPEAACDRLPPAQSRPDEGRHHA
jgi:hypothetical protein